MRGFDRQILKRGVVWGMLLLCLGLGLWGCGDRSLPGSNTSPGFQPTLSRRIAEVSPPEVIQDLRREIDTYQPQVTILKPQPNQVIEDDQVTVQFQVQDLPIFQDQTLGLGPYVQVFLDDQPYQAIYQAKQTLVFQGLTPGTHTVRAIATRPWHETFKNEGAFAQVTFHNFTETPKNNPDPNRPLLTYSRPQGSIGAEPVMLDFYLTNVPLHLIAQERSDDDIKDWRIRCTVNGERFIFDEWQPIYLKGLKPGKNWVQLELLDEDGFSTDNAFNNTVRLIIYEPGGTDTLSRMMRGELAIADLRGLIDPNYVVPQPPTPVPSPPPEPEALPSPEASPESIPAKSQPTLEDSRPDQAEPEPGPPAVAPLPQPSPEPDLPAEVAPAEEKALPPKAPPPLEPTSANPEGSPPATPPAAQPVEPSRSDRSPALPDASDPTLTPGATAPAPLAIGDRPGI